MEAIAEKERAILIVDDEPDIRSFLFDALHEMPGLGDWEILTSPDGEDGYNVICAEQPTLVIIDFEMPGHSGTVVTNWIQNSHPETKIIGMSSNEEAEQLFRQAGADGFLSKPFRVSELRSLVRQLLELE